MSTTILALPVGAAEKLSAPGSPIRRSIKAFMAWISARTTAHANSLAAAAIYKCLSKMSDAELRRRGLSRSTLGRDVIRIVGRGDGWPGTTAT